MKYKVLISFLFALAVGLWAGLLHEFDAKFSTIIAMITYFGIWIILNQSDIENKLDEIKKKHSIKQNRRT